MVERDVEIPSVGWRVDELVDVWEEIEVGEEER